MKTVKNFWFAAVFGLILGGSFTLAAFSEPTTVPGSTVSYPPINVGPDTQYRYGKVGIGDGSSLPDSSFTDANTFYTSGIFGSESLTVKQNATLVGNVSVGGRAIIAGALRVGQMVVGNANTTFLPGYDSSSEKFYMSAESTTNLGRGNTCTVVSTTQCPQGTVFFKYDPSPCSMGPCLPQTTCKYINPVSNPGNIGNC